MMEEILAEIIRETNYFNGKITEMNRKLNIINSKYDSLSARLDNLQPYAPTTQSLNIETRKIVVSPIHPPEEEYNRYGPNIGGNSRDVKPNRSRNASRDRDGSRDLDGSTDRDPSKVDTFETFSGYTTLHGLRYIGDRTSMLPRRFFWVLIVLLRLSLVFVQVSDRFEYFTTSPSNVKFEVNYPGTIAFPAVTFCNQNNFRISKAYEGGWQYFLIDYYHNKDAMPESSEQHLNTSLTQMFEGLAHTKEDFIVKCQWASQECSAANFTTVTLTTNVRKNIYPAKKVLRIELQHKLSQK